MTAGTASLPNGVLTDTLFDLADDQPDDVLLKPGGIRMEIRSLEDGSLIENYFQHGWRPGLEKVEVHLVFNVEEFEPSASLEVVNLVVR